MINPETGMTDTETAKLHAEEDKDPATPWSSIFHGATESIGAITGGDPDSLSKLASFGFGALGIPEVASKPLVDFALGGIKWALNGLFSKKKKFHVMAPCIRRCLCRITTQAGVDHFREGILIQPAFATSTTSESSAKKGLVDMLKKPSASGYWSTAATSSMVTTSVAKDSAGNKVEYQIPINEVVPEKGPALVVFPSFEYIKPNYGKLMKRNGLQYLIAFLAGKPLGIFGDGVFADKEIRAGIKDPNFDVTASLTCRRIHEPKEGGNKIERWFDITEVYDPSGTTKHWTDASDMMIFLTTPSTDWYKQTNINGADVRLTTLMAITNFDRGRKIEEISEHNKANLWFDSPQEAQPRDLLAAAFGIQSMWSWSIPKGLGCNTLQTCAEINTKAYSTAEALSTGIQQEVTGWVNQLFPPLAENKKPVPALDHEDLGDGAGTGFGIGALAVAGILAYALLGRR